MCRPNSVILSPFGRLTAFVTACHCVNRCHMCHTGLPCVTRPRTADRKSASRGRRLRLSKKWLRHFFEKDSLRSAPRLPAESGQFDARSAQSVFCQKVNCPAVGKRSPSGGRTCRGRKPIIPLSRLRARNSARLFRQTEAPPAGGAFGRRPFSMFFYMVSMPTVARHNQIIIVSPFSSMPISTSGAPGSYSPSSVQGISSAVSAVTCLTWRKMSPSELQ